MIHRIKVQKKYIPNGGIPIIWVTNEVSEICRLNGQNLLCHKEACKFFPFSDDTQEVTLLLSTEPVPNWIRLEFQAYKPSCFLRIEKMYLFSPSGEENIEIAHQFACFERLLLDLTGVRPEQKTSVWLWGEIEE